MKIFRAFNICIIFITCLFALTGCTFLQENIQLQFSRKTPLPSISYSTLVAGAAREDITPPPGMPLAGYSIWANNSKGFRTRLYARAVYLKDSQGTSVAVVQCDLLSGSLLLNRRVAELIADKTDIGIENLMIAGTHTHSGPGNFFENNFYNDHAANAPGLDTAYYEYLSQKIARAVIRAYQMKKPAKIATGKIEIWNVTRNRSLESYRANKNISSENSPGIYEAINPDLYLMRIDALDDNGQYRPLASISSFSIHGTAVPRDNELYHGDVFAFMEREVEFGIQNTYKISWTPIHAAFNGTHADNSPNYSRQSFEEARRIGTIIGKKAWKLFCSLEGQLKNDIVIRFRTREINLFSEPCAAEICLCNRPVVGSALAAGADDGPSPVISKLPWLRQGSPRWFFTNFCQGHKRTLGGPLQYLILSKEDFPHELFLQVLQIGEALLIPLPFETTKEAGLRMVSKCRQQITNGSPHDLKYFFVISCANGYFGYMTTPEEYSRQRYEGGHTLYGPQTQPFVAAQLERLTRMWEKKNPETPIQETWTYRLRTKQFVDKKIAGNIKRKALSEPVLIRPDGGKEAYWSFSWEDTPPGFWAWDQTIVRIEESRDGKNWKNLVTEGRDVDDSNDDLAVLCNKIRKRDSQGIYETRWYYRLSGQQDGGKIFYRFAILPQGTRGDLYSSPFLLK